MSSGHTQFFTFPAHDGCTPHEPLRQRRAHRKSRAGCKRCRSRKVKCDESLPQCKACVVRGVQCLYRDALGGEPRPKDRLLAPEQPKSLISVKEAPLEPSNPSATTGASSIAYLILEPSTNLAPPNVGVFNQLELSLVHHFTMVTSILLPHGQQFWQGVISVGSRTNFILNAVLAIAASHRRFLGLSTQENQYYMLECVNRDYALSGLRSALTCVNRQEDFECLLACSILLNLHAWSFVDIKDDGNLNFAMDGVFVLTRGTRDLVLHLKQGRLETLIEKLFAHTLASELRALFPALHRLCYKEGSDEIDRKYAGAALILMAILGAIKMGRVSDEQHYLLSWPALCSKEYMKLLWQDDKQALAILVHFYAAASTLSSSSDWLFKVRSQFMCRAIGRRIGDHWKGRLDVPRTLFLE